jgi:hypothetical protein
VYLVRRPITSRHGFDFAQTPEDIAQALALKTTADVTTVEGGNIAAALR